MALQTQINWQRLSQRRPLPSSLLQVLKNCHLRLQRCSHCKFLDIKLVDFRAFSIRTQIRNQEQAKNVAVLLRILVMVFIVQFGGSWYNIWEEKQETGRHSSKQLPTERKRSVQNHIIIVNSRRNSCKLASPSATDKPEIS